jgi:hypothetical protein
MRSQSDALQSEVQHTEPPLVQWVMHSVPCHQTLSPLTTSVRVHRKATMIFFSALHNHGGRLMLINRSTGMVERVNLIRASMPA